MHPSDPHVYLAVFVIAVATAFEGDLAGAAVLLGAIGLMYYDREVRGCDSGGGPDS